MQERKCCSYPRHNQLSSQVLHLCLDLTADVELVAVQGNALKVSQQVLLTGHVVWALRDRERKETINMGF